MDSPNLHFPPGRGLWCLDRKVLSRCRFAHPRERALNARQAELCWAEWEINDCLVLSKALGLTQVLTGIPHRHQEDLQMLLLLLSCKAQHCTEDLDVQQLN